MGYGVTMGNTPTAADLLAAIARLEGLVSALPYDDESGPIIDELLGVELYNLRLAAEGSAKSLPA